MTAVLLAAAVYSAFRASRKSALARRVDHGLHALMMTAMVVMLAPGNPWPALPQILIFVLAAWWFVLRAASRRATPGARLRLAGRGKPFYDALAMAAVAYMLAAMDFRGAHKMNEAAGIMGQALHHGGGAAVGQLPAWSMQDWGTQPALMLAVAFAVACAVWAARLAASLGGGSSPSSPSLRARTLRSADLGSEFVSASAMAVMFAVLAA
jgi:cbb3-type cytochrome oxidase subunit 3